MSTATAFTAPAVDDTSLTDPFDGFATNDKPEQTTAQPTSQRRSLDSSKPDLVAFLSDAGHNGAVALEARCPDHEATQIVLDEAGRLHLLTQHTSDAKGAGASLRSAMVDLIETRTWVTRHLQLLQLTQRQCRFDTQSPPVLHVFTDEAKTATSMIARVGDDVKLHLLKRVNVGNESAWFSTELN